MPPRMIHVHATICYNASADSTIDASRGAVTDLKQYILESTAWDETSNYSKEGHHCVKVPNESHCRTKMRICSISHEMF